MSSSDFAWLVRAGVLEKLIHREEVAFSPQGKSLIATGAIFRAEILFLLKKFETPDERHWKVVK